MSLSQMLHKRKIGANALLLSAHSVLSPLWLFVFFAAQAFIYPAAAYAYAVNHEYNWRGHSPFGSGVYLTQQAQYERSIVHFGKAEKLDFRGLSLHSAIGMEHFRFLQTGLFYNNISGKEKSNSADLWQGHEVGAEAKIVLSSPIVNVSLLGGALLSRKDYQLNFKRGSLQGNGGRGGIEFSYFASSKVSLVFSAVQQTENLSSNSAGSTNEKVTTQSTRLGAGLSLWL